MRLHAECVGVHPECVRNAPVFPDESGAVADVAEYIQCEAKRIPVVLFDLTPLQEQVCLDFGTMRSYQFMQ